MKTIPTLALSPDEFAVIIDVNTGKQVADYGSPHLSVAECLENAAFALAGQELLAALQRAEFLIRRVSAGDHKAIEKLDEAAAECRAAIRLAGRSPLND